MVKRGLALSLAGVLVLMAMVTTGVAAAAISQSYQADEELPAGTLVATQSGQDNKVQAADNTTNDRLVGVVVSQDDATISLARPTDTTQVSSEGVVTVFVSDLGGEVKAGDAITTSPIKGVGMKATTAGKVVGTAQSDASYGSTTTAVRTAGGKEVLAKVGSVPVVLQVTYFVPPEEATIVPKFLQVFAESIAGKDVSLVRLVISGLILFGTLIVVGVLLFSAAHSALVSIGRNPLAHTSIYRGLWQVIATALAVFIAGVGIAYMVLRI